MSRVIHFEIPASRSISRVEVLSEIFGWTSQVVMADGVLDGVTTARRGRRESTAATYENTKVQTTTNPIVVDSVDVPSRHRSALGEHW